MVAVHIPEQELKELAKATPDFEAFLDELRKNPNFELEVVETAGVMVMYQDEFDK